MSKFLRNSYISFVLFLLYAPLLVIILMSFNQSTFSSQWKGFTFYWYQLLSHNSSIWTAAYHSILLASSTSLVASTLATLTAVLLLRRQLIGKKILLSMILVLIVIPDIIFGIALLITYNAFKIPFGYLSLLIAHVAFCYPFVLMVIYSRLQDFDKHIIEAAQDLGASDVTIMQKIMLPLLLPAIISGSMLAVALSLDDVIISYFVSGADFEILPLRIFSLVRQGVKPELNALFTILFILTLIVSVAVYKLNQKDEVRCK